MLNRIFNLQISSNSGKISYGSEHVSIIQNKYGSVEFPHQAIQSLIFVKTIQQLLQLLDLCVLFDNNKKFRMGNQSNGCFKSCIMSSKQTDSVKNRGRLSEYKYQHQTYVKKKSPINRFKTASYYTRGGNQVKIPRSIRVSIKNSLKYEHPDAIKQVSERLQYSMTTQNIIIQGTSSEMDSVISDQGERETYKIQMVPTRGSLTSDQLLPSIVIKQTNYDAKLQYQKQLKINHQ